MSGFAISLPRRRRRRRRKPNFIECLVLLFFVISVVYLVGDIIGRDMVSIMVQSIYTAGWWISPNFSWWLFGRWRGRPAEFYKGAGRILHDWIIGDPE